jgi:hypothetical protein
MPINLYSKDSVDNLLDAKLSITSLSNAATSTLNAGVPTAGQALTYDGTDLIWATVSGSAAWGAITGTLSSQTDLQGELDLKAPLAGPSFTSGITVDGAVTVLGPSGNPTFTYSGLDLSPSSGGITFADATVQTTAAVAPPSADVLTANAIASNIYSMGYGSSTWVGNGLPSIASLIGWGIYNTTDGLIAYSYSSGNSFYLASTPTTLANSSVQVNGSNSSFYVA